jgi:Myotubularin-like phosphatase domain
MLQGILVGTNDVLTALTKDFENVVIHCSDGWDRTS